MIHKYLVTLLLTALTIGSPVSASNMQKAEKLILAEQYSEALEIIFPLAKSVDINAQLRLAKMYYQGQGCSDEIIEALQSVSKTPKEEAEYRSLPED